jgi:hypothetical protein
MTYYEPSDPIDQQVGAYVLGEYRSGGSNDHLRTCPDARLANLDGGDGSYGCDTGCEYVEFTVDVMCPHGESVVGWQWGSFNTIADMIEEMAASRTLSPSPLTHAEPAS